MKLLKCSISFFAVMLMASQYSLAQSSQYQRPGKKKAAAAAKSAVTDKSTPQAETKDAKKDAKSEKVDIQQIEQEYWQQKDTEFHVVQSRRYTKEKRWFASAGYGLLINDNFNKGGMLMVSGGYYLKETYGIEAFYMDFNASNSKTINEIFDLGGGPSYSHPTREIGVTFNWMPIYGKVSVFDKTIIYYDLGLDVGLGLHQYERVIDTGNESGSAPMLILDITQQFFLNEKWALRFDIKNRYYKIKLKKYDSPYTEKNDTNFATDALLGFVFYFK